MLSGVGAVVATEPKESKYRYLTTGLANEARVQ